MQALKQYCDMAGKITNAQYESMLAKYNCPQVDYLPLNRVAGFAAMKEDVKVQSVNTILSRVEDRDAMLDMFEHVTMDHIAQWMDRQEYTI